MMELCRVGPRGVELSLVDDSGHPCPGAPIGVDDRTRRPLRRRRHRGAVRVRRLPPILVGLALSGALLIPGEAPADPVDDTWRSLLIASGPAAAEEPPHPEALHEWWFFTVQNPTGDTLCGPWQAMVSPVADRESVNDRLLFTAVIDGVPLNFSQEFLPGSMERGATKGATEVTLGASRFSGAHPSWTVHAETAEATLDLTLDATHESLWRRRAPEGWGLLEITFAVRAAATGSLHMAATGRTCAVTGTGYVEHVWGTWSRIPMWGVDYLNAHLDGGWSAYARRTPMRGEDSLYPRLGLRAEDFYPPTLVLRAPDGTVTEAHGVAFVLDESSVTHADLGVPLPLRYVVTGVLPNGQTATLTVADPALATILFPATSSGVLEGWGSAELALAGDPPMTGTVEIEMQRFGTTFPH